MGLKRSFWPLVGIILGLVASRGYGTCDPTLAPSYTTRSGLVVPQINSCSWGTVTNQNWNILDSSTSFLSLPNIFTNTNNFNGINFKSGNGAAFYNANNTVASGIQNVGASGKAQLQITSPNGLAIGNGAPLDTQIGNPSMEIYPGSFQTYGSFAVIGSSADSTTAYSGFIGTSPITASTLWSLPVKDGTVGQAMTTDGNAHLSFTTIVGGGGGGGGLVSLSTGIITPAVFAASVTINSSMTVGNLAVSGSSISNTSANTFQLLSNNSEIDVGLNASDGACATGALRFFTSGSASNRMCMTTDTISFVGPLAGGGGVRTVTLAFPPAGIPASYTWNLPIADSTGAILSDGLGNLSVQKVILSTSVLQSGTTFYVSSGTITGPLILNGPGNGYIQETITGSTYSVISSSGPTNTVGHLAVWSSTNNTLMDGGVPGSGGGSGTITANPQFQVAYYSGSGSSNIISSSPNFTNNGSTITMTGINAIVQTNVSSEVASGVWFDYTTSTLTVSSATVLNQAGTTSGGNAASGMIGEYLSSSAVTAVSFPSTGVFGDLVSMTLTAGDWDVSAVLGSKANGATVTTMQVGISSTTGNSSAGLIEGDNFINALGPTAATDTFGSIPSFRVSLSVAKTYYLKYESAFSVATPQAIGRLSARRIR